MEAWDKGISTCKVDALVATIGSQAGISHSEVSLICQGLDEQIQAFLERPLDGTRYPYLYLDATYLHGRLGKTLQVCSRAVLVAMGVNADGRRELLDLQVGDSERNSSGVSSSLASKSAASLVCGGECQES
jgi:putative transposase